MLRVAATRIILTCVVAVWPCGAATGQTVSAGPGQQQQRHSGFFDYVLDKVNPNGNDFGASIQSRRNALVEHSIDDLYFWSNVVTLLLLTGSSATVLLHWRAADKREVIAASLITQLWNARVSDRVEIELRTNQFNRLVETHNIDVERNLTLRSEASETLNENGANLNKNVQKVTAKPGARGNRGDMTQLKLSMEAVSADANGASDPEQESLLLQRRLEALQNSEQNLKQRLNQTTLLLDQERRRNGSLKGA